MKDRNKYEVNFICILSVLLTSLPLCFSGIEGHFGQDLGFHLNRIEGIYLELKNGVFPVRMQSFWMDGYGYPVSIYYGDTFLYFPALLRLMGVNVVAAYKIFLFLINVLTVFVTRYCLERIFVSAKPLDEDLYHRQRRYAALGTLVYVTGNYRLLNLYIRAAVGEYTAMLFLPLIALAVYLLYEKDTADKTCRAAIIPLVIGMSGILESHMMTLEMVCIVLGVICVFRWKKTFRKETFFVFFFGAVFTLLLNLYFILPFLDYFLTENVRINQVVQNARQIQESGAYLWEYVAFFMIPFSNLEPGITSDRMSVTPGLILIVTLAAGAGAILLKKADTHIKKLVVGVGFLLFLSSHFFPWNALSTHTSIGNFLAQVQFPWRYIGIASLLLSLLLVCLLLRSKHDLTVGIVVVSCVMCVWFAGVYGKYAELDHFADTKDLDTYDMGFIEYLRPDAVREEFTGSVEVTEGEAVVREVYRRGTAVDYAVICASDARIELPILNYKYYVMRDDEGNTYTLSDGANDVISFAVPAGFDGKLHLRYEVPLSWHIAEIISLLTLICCGLWVVRRKERPLLFAGSRQ